MIMTDRDKIRNKYNGHSSHKSMYDMCECQGCEEDRAVKRAVDRERASIRQKVTDEMIKALREAILFSEGEKNKRELKELLATLDQKEGVPPSSKCSFGCKSWQRAMKVSVHRNDCPAHPENIKATLTAEKDEPRLISRKGAFSPSETIRCECQGLRKVDNLSRVSRGLKPIHNQYCPLRRSKA